MTVYSIDELRVRLEEARATGATPRLHGNGFIQVDLSERIRAHFWGPSLPRQSVPTPIHDHRFGFESRVLAGELLNIDYWALPCLNANHGTHVPYVAQVRQGEDTILIPDDKGRTVRLQITKARSIRAGEFYSMQPRDIHESYAHCPAISVIEKDAPTLAQGGKPPRVFVPLGLSPDNSFSRFQVEPDRLWRFVGELLVRFSN